MRMRFMRSRIPLPLCILGPLYIPSTNAAASHKDHIIVQAAVAAAAVACEL